MPRGWGVVGEENVGGPRQQYSRALVRRSLDTHPLYGPPTLDYPRKYNPPLETRTFSICRVGLGDFPVGSVQLVFWLRGYGGFM